MHNTTYSAVKFKSDWDKVCAPFRTSTNENEEKEKKRSMKKDGINVGMGGINLKGRTH